MKKIEKAILEEKKYCQKKLKKIMGGDEFDSDENLADLPEYWIGRIDQLDFALSWVI
ncbi:MAG: hypothetical protein V3V81_08235 [Candidatus Bathyarchaeia archaeon]